jgi:hypothetical protein
MKAIIVDVLTVVMMTSLDPKIQTCLIWQVGRRVLWHVTGNDGTLFQRISLENNLTTRIFWKRVYVLNTTHPRNKLDYSEGETFSYQ